MLLEVMQQFHESLSKQLDALSARIERMCDFIHVRMAPDMLHDDQLEHSLKQLKSPHSSSSSESERPRKAASKTSMPPKVARREKKVPTQILAMEALEMDISNKVIGWKRQTSNSPGVSTSAEAFLQGPMRRHSSDKRRANLQDLQEGEANVQHLCVPVPGVVPEPSRAKESKEEERASAASGASAARHSCPAPGARMEAIASANEDEGSLQASPKSKRRVSSVASTHNLRDVFKAKENQLAADLFQGRDLTPAEDDELEVDEGSSAHLAPRGHQWLKLSFLDTFVSVYASRVLGLVPWCRMDAHSSWHSRAGAMFSRLYHILIVLGLIAHIVSMVSHLSFCYMNSDDDWCLSSSWPPAAVDLGLFIGALLVLLSFGGIRYEENTELTARSLRELHVYCEQTDLDVQWKIWSCCDALRCVLLWLMINAGRWYLYAFMVHEEGRNDGSFTGRGAMSYFITGSWSTCILVVASFWQVKTSHAMLLIVNSWSAWLVGGASCAEAKRQWRRVSGLFRRTSRTFERCFAALGSTIVILLLMALYDLRQGRDLQILASCIMAFFLPGVLLTHASTTTACNRLPSLVTLCEADEDEEDEYMDLAMFLSLSECGFFMWDTCVSLGLVQKFLYFTGAIAGSIGFQVGAFNFTA